MPTGRGSHRWCSVCHARWIDKSKHKNMCKVCYRKWEDRVRKERQRIKARRAARSALQNGVATMPLEPKPEIEAEAQPVAKPRSKPIRLSEEQEQEIITLYTTTNEPLDEICRTFGINNQRMYLVFSKRHLDWRRNDPISYETYLQRQAQAAQNGQHAEPEPSAQVVETVPEPVEKALERMLRLPPSPEPVAQPVRRPAPSMPEYVDQVLPEDEGMVWEIQYVGRMLVKARDIDHALQQARQDGHLTQIVGVTMRSR